MPGSALVTTQHIEAYTANSVLYEAPAVGFPIQDTNLDGGTLSITARAVDFPPVQSSSFSPLRSHPVGYAEPMEVNIVASQQADDELYNGR